MLEPALPTILQRHFGDSTCPKEHCPSINSDPPLIILLFHLGSLEECLPDLVQCLSLQNCNLAEGRQSRPNSVRMQSLFISYLPLSNRESKDGVGGKLQAQRIASILFIKHLAPLIVAKSRCIVMERMYHVAHLTAPSWLDVPRKRSIV